MRQKVLWCVGFLCRNTFYALNVQAGQSNEESP